MTATPGAPWIEIIDPAREPFPHGPDAARVATVAPVPVADAWIGSLRAAGRTALLPLAPLRRVVVGPLAGLAHAGHARSLQVRHDGNPRHGSAVRQHVFAPFAVVAERLERVDGSLRVRGGVRLELTTAFGPLPGGGRQADARLALRGSWPRLPMVVRVEPWWRDRSVITVELRSRRRVRYPRRYFRSAHRVARAFGASVVR